MVKGTILDKALSSHSTRPVCKADPGAAMQISSSTQPYQSNHDSNALTARVQPLNINPRVGFGSQAGMIERMVSPKPACILAQYALAAGAVIL
jgi:hypothetical protein